MSNPAPTSSSVGDGFDYFMEPVLSYSNEPYIEIIEQPAFDSFTYRYSSEIKGKSLGSILGVHSTEEVRTYPTIKVINYQGPYAVVISCVTKDPPYRPHPHNLFGKENCEKGVYRKIFDGSNMTCSFTSLCIKCVKKRDIEQSLRIRETQHLDPFGTGFNHAGHIDLHELRLCFQVFIPGPDNCLSSPLPAVVSDPICNRKSYSKLNIVKLSHYSAPVTGGTEVILLCDRVAKEDIEIWFYEEQGTRTVWEGQAAFQSTDVYKQVAISFKTPRYHNVNIQHPCVVFLQLRKPSKNQRGEPRSFAFVPIAREEQMPTAVPRTWNQPFHQRINGSTTGNQSVLAIRANESYHQPAISFEHCISPTLTTMSAPVVGPPHLHSLAAVPGAHSQTSVIPAIETLPSPTTTRSSMYFEYYRSPNLTAVPVSVVSQSATPHLSPTLATSHGAHRQTSVVQSTATFTSPIIQQMLQQYLQPVSTEMDYLEEEAFLEKFDSLEISMTLSATLFDSA